MSNSKVLLIICTGRGVRICGLGHYLPFFVRYAAHNSYDAIWLDLEHRAMDQREIQGLLAMCHAHDIDCMVRAPTLEGTRLYRYFEDGATGLMMPLVSDAGLAREIVEAVKYPPLGNRGLDGAGLDGDFGLDVWHEGSTYIDDAIRETFIVLQIETPEALANVDEIAAVDGVDGVDGVDRVDRIDQVDQVDWPGRLGRLGRPGRQGRWGRLGRSARPSAWVDQVDQFRVDQVDWVDG